MIVYTIKADEKHKGYETSKFYVNWMVNGQIFIASENNSMGFMVRNDMTETRFLNHITNMIQEGFNVTVERA